VGDTGLELPPDFSGNTHIATQSGADSGALGARIGCNDPGLARLIDAWPGLLPDVRQSILKLARKR
jgi:hypothetical protein